MRKIANPLRAAAVTSAVAACALGAAGAASASGTGHPSTRAAIATAVASGTRGNAEGDGERKDGGFGYTTVRRGIPDSAVRFSVSSPQIHDGGTFPASAWAGSFGCTGGNQQFTLHWHGAPATARSFAVTMFDPDAPTGSGFWHWLVWDIPSNDTELTPDVPAGAVVGTDDAGVTGYLGPCPPAGDIEHHYVITVYALNVPSLGLTSSVSPALASFTMSGHIVGYARMTVDARRP
jgi:Raf kinase inhibitor-like YbhB/YbcL family protein